CCYVLPPPVIHTLSLHDALPILDQIDYKPNLIARTLGSKKNYKIAVLVPDPTLDPYWELCGRGIQQAEAEWRQYGVTVEPFFFRSEEHTSELQSRENLVCRLLLE